MRSLLFALAMCAAAQPATAQLTTTYTGTQTQGGKQVAATATFAVENGHVAMIMTGIHSGRLIFDEKSQVLHMISDEEKTYMDIDKSTAGRGDPMQMMQQQMDKLTPAQRAQAQQMMSGMSGMMNSNMPPQLTYVTSTEKKKVAGYECTRVDGMRGTDKVTEYCGTTSDDFKMSDAERKTMLDMQSYLRNFTIMVKTTDDTMRAFQWDTSVDGYPVITRCFSNGEMTLDLTLQSVSRKPIPNDLFELPKGYKKMDMNSMMGRGRSGR